MLPQYRLEKLAGMSMLAGASTWITHNTKFQSKAGYLGPRGGVSSPGELSILTTLHFLQGALHNKMNKVRVYQHHPKSMGLNTVTASTMANHP
jgi:hypothetical protein